MASVTSIFSLSLSDLPRLCSDFCHYQIPNCVTQGSDLSPSQTLSALAVTSSALTCQPMATEVLSPVQWLSWSQFHVPNPLMKSYSRLSTWCLRLNTLGLKSTNHVFPKPPDLPVSEAKLPFSFSLIPKPQLLLANFSFPSCLKLSLPPILQSSQILLHTSIHLFSSSATIFSQAQLRHLCTEGVVTS